MPPTMFINTPGFKSYSLSRVKCICSLQDGKFHKILPLKHLRCLSHSPGIKDCLHYPLWQLLHEVHGHSVQVLFLWTGSSGIFTHALRTHALLCLIVCKWWFQSWWTSYMPDSGCNCETVVRLYVADSKRGLFRRGKRRSASARTRQDTVSSLTR